MEKSEDPRKFHEKITIILREKMQYLGFIYFFKIPVDKTYHFPYSNQAIRRRVEQLAARRAHNPKVVGPSPTPAKQLV